MFPHEAVVVAVVVLVNVSRGGVSLTERLGEKKGGWKICTE